MELVQGTVLFEIGDVAKRVYFPHTGVVSLVVNLSSGEMIETGMVGRDSLVGASAILNGRVALNKGIVQIAGSASFVELSCLHSLAKTSEEFRTTIIRHDQMVLVQAQQSAACNICHT